MDRLTERIQGSKKDLVVYIGQYKKHEADISAEVTPRGVRDVLRRLADYEDTGLGPEEVTELAQAEKDGRLAAFPCKAGDYVFDISDGTPYKTRVLSFSYFGDGHWACRTVSSYPDLKEFGTRIFLTREAAEAALEEMYND